VREYVSIFAKVYFTARSGGGSSLRREPNTIQIPPNRKTPPTIPGANVILLSTLGVMSRAGVCVSLRGDKLITACTSTKINPNTNNAMPCTFPNCMRTPESEFRVARPTTNWIGQLRSI
jgi:hypothetical protein